MYFLLKIGIFPASHVSELRGVYAGYRSCRIFSEELHLKSQEVSKVRSETDTFVEFLELFVAEITLPELKLTVCT